ncbi:MAG TPA: helix-hairpin-helix domain-containing protein [Bacillaceae bacterium]
MVVWIEKYKSLLIGSLVVLIGGFLFISERNEKQADESLATLPMEREVAGEETPETDTESPSAVYVDIKGEVKKPGLYEANEGDRVFDVIEQSGGLLDTADRNQINFALKVHDEMVIYIPKIGELDMHPMPLVMDGQEADGKINLNKADAAELENLPGIGPAKAKAILDYREQNGPFKDIEELKEVSGIGEKTFEKLQNDITVR